MDSSASIAKYDARLLLRIFLLFIHFFIIL